MRDNPFNFLIIAFGLFLLSAGAIALTAVYVLLTHLPK
jgi:hypothetical protein